MSKSRYIKTKSNFTLQRKYYDTEKGTIYERDFMTNKEFVTYGQNGRAIWGDSNFKFISRETPSFQKRYHKTDFLIDGNDGEIISFSNSGKNPKPDYSSIKDFAYYGSAKELVKASINEIIMKFPAEIYFDEGGIGKNSFNIDFFTKFPQLSENDNKLRYMYFSYDKYNVLINEKEYPIISWNALDTEIGEGAKEFDSNCVDIRTIFSSLIECKGLSYKITIKKAYDKSKKKWIEKAYNEAKEPITKFSIRPNKKESDKFFNEIDPFEKTILNTQSNPIYKAIFNTAKETEYGNITMPEEYIMPSYNSWNPDILSMPFKNYVNNLLSLAEYHDGYDSDNIWRSMTHEPIKNMDWTLTKEDGEVIDGIDVSKVVPILRIWGRQADDIKLFIDGIGYTNSVSYNEKKNTPDDNLIDSLYLSGWDAKQVTISNNPLLKTDPLFPGEKEGYTTEEFNMEFFKRLKLSSKYIFTEKGTKKAIRDILGMFGMKERTGKETEDETSILYEIKEYVTIADGKKQKPESITEDNDPSYPPFDIISKFNKSKNSYPHILNENDPLFGLPLKEVKVHDNESQREYEYVVPWFDDDKFYDRPIYFQMKGGWNQIEKKTVINTVMSEILKDHVTSTIFTSPNLPLYEETSGFLKIVENVTDLIHIRYDCLNENNVVYVNSLEEYDKYNGKTAGERNVNNASHYFILKTKDLYNFLGYYKDDGIYGWRNIPISEFNDTVEDSYLSEDAQFALYADSITDNNSGNNPHEGNGEYDGGREFYGQFGNVLEHADFDILPDEAVDEAKTMGYSIRGLVEDNKKSWYFKDTFLPDQGLFVINENDQNSTPVKDEDVDDVKNAIKPYNPESAFLTGTKEYDEAAANSIINLKNLKLVFYFPNLPIFDNEDEAKKYIENVVMFYVKQLIPSTSIFKIEYKKDALTAGIYGAIAGKNETLLGVV